MSKRRNKPDLFQHFKFNNLFVFLFQNRHRLRDMADVSHPNRPCWQRTEVSRRWINSKWAIEFNRWINKGNLSSVPFSSSSTAIWAINANSSNFNRPMELKWPSPRVTWSTRWRRAKIYSKMSMLTFSNRSAATAKTTRATQSKVIASFKTRKQMKRTDYLTD